MNLFRARVRAPLQDTRHMSGDAPARIHSGGSARQRLRGACGGRYVAPSTHLPWIGPPWKCSTVFWQLLRIALVAVLINLKCEQVGLSAVVELDRIFAEDQRTKRICLCRNNYPRIGRKKANESTMNMDPVAFIECAFGRHRKYTQT